MGVYSSVDLHCDRSWNHCGVTKTPGCFETPANAASDAISKLELNLFKNLEVLFSGFATSVSATANSKFLSATANL